MGGVVQDLEQGVGQAGADELSNIVSDIVYGPAARFAERAAIITQSDEALTYEQMANAIARLASWLRGRGVRPGQVVAVSMGGRPPHLLTLLALAQIGAVSLPLDPIVPKDRRLLAARKFGAAWVASGSPDYRLEGLGFLDIDRSTYSDAVADRAIYPAEPGDPVFIFMTSGTSGDPKGMTITHANIAARNQTSEPGGDSPARVLQMALNYFVGIGPAMRALAHGDTLVFPAGPGGEQVLLALLTQKVTHAYITPNRASEIVGLIGANVEAACPSLVSLRIVGEHLNLRLGEMLRRRVTPNLYVAYGSTEAGVATLATPDQLARNPETVGAVCDWAEVQVIDADDAPVPAGTVGELRIRSDQLVGGYHLDEPLTRLRFRGGWFYPGDRGHFDDEGLLYIEGRTDDLINVAGSLVDAADIEKVLAAHPLVLEVGAFAAISPDGQGVLSAALVLSDPGGLAEVRTFAAGKLGRLAPKAYVAAASLPRTATGKVQRNQLAAAFPLPSNWRIPGR